MPPATPDAATVSARTDNDGLRLFDLVILIVWVQFVEGHRLNRDRRQRQTPRRLRRTGPPVSMRGDRSFLSRLRTVTALPSGSTLICRLKNR
jgi:hypothetical protein